MKTRIKVGIFLFHEVEVLDFAGPFEVFSLASIEGEKLFNVETISETGDFIVARNGLKVIPNESFATQSSYDILIIPGGCGAEAQAKNSAVIEWVKQQQKKVEFLASICTGAFILAEAGILNNKSATSHWMDLDKLEKKYPKVKILRNVKYVDEGKILTSGGISAGINLSFHLVRRIFGVNAVKETAKIMEYDIELKEV